DVDEVQRQAGNTLNELDKIDVSSLKDMEKQHLEAIKNMLTAIEKSKDIQDQRTHFKILSDNMIAFAANLENPDRKLYVQRCPMANENKGAEWLSFEEEIRNPYFGEAMLTCGEVIKTIE